MPFALPFDPTDLATALPDVLWAIGIAFALAFITFKPKSRKTRDEAIEDVLAAVGDAERSTRRS